MSTMSQNMDKARILAETGHNLIITGQCGTGKSFLMRKLIKCLSEHRKVAVTATTGMASTQLGIGATTLHHWCGVMDGRYTSKQLHELMFSEESYGAAKDRILMADILFVDEIGMLSLKMFDLIESVCRMVRGNDCMFGGLQVIVSGDFKQLPPVPNHWYNDDGSYCFLSSNFQNTFPHHINLIQVLRQSEADLISAVNQLCDGTPSKNTIHLLKSLDRPLPDTVTPTLLFGTRFDVNYINQMKIEDMEGPAVFFNAKDEGDRRLLRHCDAPKTLILKERAPVIVTRNIGGGVFNGSRGIVHDLKNGSDPIILINGKCIQVRRFIFDIYDVNRKKSLAHRLQYPIQLAFALTVHKSQGQTLDNVEVDCFSFFAPGQMGVAVGRCVSKAGLKIVHFNRQAAELKHPKEVYSFYEVESKDPLDNLLCCRQTHSIVDEGLQFMLEYVAFPSPHVDLVAAHEEKTHECPWKVNDFLEENLDSNFMEFIPPDIINNKNNKLQSHLNHLHFKVIQASSKGDKKRENWVEAYSFLNKFLVSVTHEQLCEDLFDSKPINKHQNKFSSKLVFWLMECEIRKRSSEIIEKQQEKFDETAVPVHTPSVSGQGKIRYIAGACIYRISQRVQNSVLKNLGNLSNVKRLARKSAYQKQQLLKTLRVSEVSTDLSDPSMQEIQYRQSSSRGLFVVADTVYKFFVFANELIQKYLAPKYLHLKIENLQKQISNLMFSNQDLVDGWINLFDVTCTLETEDRDDEMFMALLLDLFVEVIDHFIKLAFVDAIKEFKAKIPRKKRQALRTKVSALGERADKMNKKQ